MHNTIIRQTLGGIEKMEKPMAFEKHKDRRINEMHERFLNYALNKKKGKLLVNLSSEMKSM